MRRAALIFNPVAGPARLRDPLPSLCAALFALGFDLQLRPTVAPGEATALARAAAAGGAEVAFALGGDGTLREVAEGLAGSSCALGVLPGGTTNVVARALGLPLTPIAAAQRLARAPVTEVDLGLCGGRTFLMQASAGLDARVMAATPQSWKRRFGKAGIAAAGMREWRRFPYSEIHLRADGRERSASFLAVANLPYYGGNFRLLPQARWDDRRLDLLLFHGRGRAATLAFAFDLARGAHLRRADVEVFPVESVVIVAPTDLPLQCDGDPLDCALPVTIGLAPQRLRILAPS